MLANVIHHGRVFLEKLTVAQLVKKFKALYEMQSPITGSQDNTISPRPEPNVSVYTLPSYPHFNIIFLHIPESSKFSDQNFEYIFYLSHACYLFYPYLNY